MIAFFHHLVALIGFLRLEPSQRRLCFYSEGKSYWPNFSRLIETILQDSQLSICYISSDAKDPGLQFNHQRYHCFKIDNHFIRDWFFANLQADVMVMTMPDLNQFQIKRSYHPVHYVYLQHALVSLHMAYRFGAFDHFDTIFCAGPHHVKEIRAMEKLYHLPAKILVQHGYPRLDNLINQKSDITTKNNHSSLHILIAPSWGKEAAIESGRAAGLVDKLLTEGYQVTLRPHPETIKQAKKQVLAIVNTHQKNPNFYYEDNIAGQHSLFDSDCMISDWSGAALDYALGFNKAVFFLETPKKVNNPHYAALELEPFEVSIRNKIGEVIDQNTDFSQKKSTVIAEDYVFNLGHSHQVASQYLINLCLTGNNS